MYTSERTWACSRCHEIKPVEQFYKRSLKSRFNWCKKCHRTLTRNYSQARYHQDRSKLLLEKYGITDEQYESMLSAQGGGCAICGKHVTESRLCVDHDHATKKVRALLCKACNLMIGSAKDNPVILIEGANYLKKHEEL